MPASEDRSISKGIAFFVCGVTSNRRGFEHVGLGPRRLPGSPSRYLDVYPSASGGRSYGFQRLEIDRRAYVRYSRYIKVNPNDAETNRGAYLAVGFIAGRILSMHEAATCIDFCAQICGHLKHFIGPDNRVSPDFELTRYKLNAELPEELESGCSPVQQLDVLLQALNLEGSLQFAPNRPVYLEARPFSDIDQMEHPLFYFDKGASGAQLERDRERDKLKRLARQLMRAASYADQVQDEWLAYHAMIQQHLPSVVTRGTELRTLIEDVEHLAGSADELDPPVVGSPPRQTDRARDAHPRVGSVPPRYRSVAASSYRDRGRRARGTRRRAGVTRVRVAVGIGTTVVLMAAVALIARHLLLGPEDAPGATGGASAGAEHPGPPVVADPEMNARPGQGATSPSEPSTEVGPTADPGGSVGGASQVEGAGSPADRSPEDEASADIAPVDLTPEDARSNVVRERAALGQRPPE